MNQVDTPVLSHAGMRAIVTGGAEGIGASICIGLAAAGAKVCIVDLEADKAQNLANKINLTGCEAIALRADVANEKDCLQAIEGTVNSFGGLDILVNCAAPGRNKSKLGKLTDADWEMHQKVIINGVVILADAASEFLAASSNGAIVNISSITSSSVALDQCSWPYHVAKAGLDQLTRWLAVRLAAKSIRVNAVAPGLIDRSTGFKLTDRPENLDVIKTVVPLGRAGSGDDIAKAVIFLSSRQSTYITGQVLVVDGGLSLNEVFGTSLRSYKFGVNSALG